MKKCANNGCSFWNDSVDNNCEELEAIDDCEDKEYEEEEEEDLIEAE